jgi:PHD/YefM family antitoxin component YafN of YafNO toxin-antitoxin module
MKIKNISEGARGFNAVSGPIMLNPGEEIDAKVYEREKEHLEATQWFEVDGDYVANPDSKATEAAQVTVTSVDGKDGVYIPASEFNAMREGFERQNAEIDRLNQENAALRDQLADGDKASASVGPFEVKETSAGWFGIFGADGNQVGKNMRAADADAFKAMTPEEQTAYVAE